VTRPDEPINPMTLGNMRQNGVRGLCVTCKHCGYETAVNVDAYALDDLKAWADLGAKTSTSDPGAGTVYPAKRVLAPSHANGHPNRR
jgi:hypothetical protein